MPAYLTFEGEVAFITGAGSGIGRMCAEQLSQLGAKVVVTDRMAAAVDEVAKSINAIHPGSALALEVDVTKWEQIERGVKQTVQHFGRIDIAINSAGVVIGNELRLVKDTLMEDYDMINNVDARGLYMCMKAQLTEMTKQELKPGRAGKPGKRGSIVNISSRAGVEGVSKFGPYCAAKHAVIGMTKSAALDHAEEGIRVNAILPGLIKTPGHKSAAKEVDDFLMSKVPMARWGLPQECVDGILYLASDMSSFVAGSTLEVDGGSAARSR